MALWEGKIPKWAAWIIILVVLFIIIYTYYGIYKILTGKYRYCGSKEVGGKFRKAIIFGFIPWRKPKFICLSCQKKLTSKHKKYNTK